MWVKKGFLFIALFAITGKALGVRPTGEEQEPAIWVNTLNYRLSSDAKIFDSSDDWHQKQDPHLTQLRRLAGGTRNIAVARIGMVTRSSSGELHENTYQLPYVYVSGWEALKNPSYSSVQGYVKTCYRPDLDYKVVSIAECGNYPNPRQQGALHYARHLHSIFHSSTVLLDNMHPHHVRLQATRDHLKHCTRTPAFFNDKDKEDDFGKRFYDTEQAIFLSVLEALKSLNVRARLLEKVELESQVCLLTLDIASQLDMCFNCGDTAFCQKKLVTGFVGSVGEMLLDLCGKYTIADRFQVLIKVSSRGKYFNFGWDSRNAKPSLTAHSQTDPLEGDLFSPYIAQMIRK